MAEEYYLVKDYMTPDYVKQIPLDKLTQFCNEIREKLIELVSQTGGHIGVNLAVVELTVALYRVFDFPKDSLIWDIGHQIYIQKMLTGRLENLKLNRKNGGSPGYSFRKESVYDRVTSSHGGASISLALGVAISNRLKKNNLISVAVVGDGAYIEGSTQEAVNHMAVDDSKLLVILNDNERAIEENFGGLHEYFKSRQVETTKKETFFSSLEIPYVGPVDGHDVINLVNQLNKIKENLRKPTILHVKTIKGKGLEKMSKASPIRIHWNHPFDPLTGKNTAGSRAKGHVDFSAVAIDEILEKHPEAVLITPAVQSTNGINDIFKKFQKRCFDVSLAEQHAITLGGGFALQKMKPIVAMESTFMQRSLDQIIHDICLNNLPILIIVARSGHTGTDHVSHNALHDLSYLRCVPNLKIVYPACHKDIKELIIREYKNLKQPTIVLFAKADILDDPSEDFVKDTDKNLKKSTNSKGLLLSVGPQNKISLEVKKLLENDGIIFDQVAVTNITPLTESLKNFLSNYDHIVTLEEGVLDGGFGSSILEYLHDNRISSDVIRIGFQKLFIEHGTRDYIYNKFKLDSNSIFKKIKTSWPELWKNL